jgi:hypothetical protein
MAEFEASEWREIFRQLDNDPAVYGLPEQRRKSVVLASWNIRKFGSLANSRGEPSRSHHAWELIVRFCETCDFIAIQEVQDSLISRCNGIF